MESTNNNPEDPEPDPDPIPQENVTPEQQLRRSARIPKPQNFEGYVTYSAFSHKADGDPITIEDALSRSDANKWKAAMNEELASLEENETWTLELLPPNKKPIKTKWEFKAKRDASGNIIRYKARLVVKGCSQKYGVDYLETYSPVVRYVSIRYLVALAVKLQLNINQMDAVTAFLQGDLVEEIYIEQPFGFHDDSEKVCKLKKAIYGLKQSGREWNRKLDGALRLFGLVKSKADSCVYFTNNAELIVAIYVDDILIFWKRESICDKIKTMLSTFKMKDMGQTTNCIGLNITYNESGISLDQSKYITEILDRFGMTDCKTAVTPSDTY